MFPTTTITYTSPVNQGPEIPEDVFKKAEKIVEAIAENPSEEEVKKWIGANPDENLLNAIKIVALAQYSVSNNLEVLTLIFKGVISLNEARGNQSEATLLKKFIEGIQNFHSSVKKTKEIFRNAILSIYLILAARMWGLPFLPAVGVGIGMAGVLSRYTEVSGASLWGLASGLSVARVGLVGSIPATAIGLGTAIVARIPLVQRAAKATLTTGCDVIGKCAEAGKPIFAATGTALKAAGKGIGNGVSQLTQGVLLPSIKGIFKVGDFAIDCAVFAVRSIDKSLDFLVGKK